MTFRAFALATLMLLPSLASDAADAPASLALAKKQVEIADYRMLGHMVRVDEKGTRTSYGIDIKAHWFPGMLRVLFEVVSPADARVHVLLEMRPGGESSIQIAHPGDAKPAILPFDKWSEGPLGAGFSYEDLLEAAYFWPSHTDQGKAKCGARNCDLIVSKPGEADETHYAEVTSWLDPESGFPVRVDKTMKATSVVKEFTYFGLHQRQGTWYANQVEAKIRGHSGSTLLIIDRGSARAHLDLKDFNSAQLTHF
ncbi:MAG: outer membrane lipoprotein-sorting protein [Terracidiphilus sp.]